MPSELALWSGSWNHDTFILHWNCTPAWQTSLNWGLSFLTECSDICRFWMHSDCTTSTYGFRYLTWTFPLQFVLVLLAGALGKDYPHQLQQGHGQYHDDYLLGGKKKCMLLPELFATHGVSKKTVDLYIVDNPLKDKEIQTNILTLVQFSWYTKLSCSGGGWGWGRLFLI